MSEALNYSPDVWSPPTTSKREDIYTVPPLDSSSGISAPMAAPQSYNVLFFNAILRKSIRSSFELYADQWSKESGAHSSMTLRKRHSAYKSIVGIGWSAVPLLLEALRSKPDFWFEALKEITGENPVRPDERGDYDKMTDAWMTWGQQKKLLP